MSNTGNQIKQLLQSNGKSASEMTHALKFIGDGSMEDGLKRIGDYFEEEAKKGRVDSAIGGAIGAAVITMIFVGLGVLIKRKIDEDKKHKEEGEAILKGLEEGLLEYSEENIESLEEK